MGVRAITTARRSDGSAFDDNSQVRFLTDVPGSPWQPPNVGGPATEASYSDATSFSPVTAAYGARSTPTGLLRASAVARWWRPTITFIDPDSRSVVGQQHTTAVLVTDRGVPLSGVDLRFYEPLGELSAELGSDTTGEDGLASVVIERDSAQTMTIAVEEELDDDIDPSDGAPISSGATTTHAFAAAPGWLGVTVGLSQESNASRVGTDVEFTASVAVGEDPMANWDVAFAVNGVAQEVATTDVEGQATARLTSTTESFAEVTANVIITGCGSAMAEIFHDWWLPDLLLNPDGTTSPARSDVAFTAELTRYTSSEETVAVPGQLIRFSMTSQSCALPVVVREARTDDDGIAGVSLSRDGPSIDGVSAEEIGVVGPASDATTHTWGAPVPPPLSISLTQDDAASRAGTEVIITATVRDTDRPGGRARSGIPVTFLGVTPTRTVPTDASGVARLTVPGTSLNPTTVTASAPFGCGVVLSGSVTHRWFVPSLELTPMSRPPPPATRPR